MSTTTESTNIVHSAGSVDNTATKPVEQREILYVWKAPQRYFKKINKKSFMILLGAVMLLFLLLVLLQQYYFMAAVAAMVFLIYVLGTFPPPLVTNIITNKGVEAASELYLWEVLKNFYFSYRDEQILLNIETTLRNPGKIIFLVDEKQQEEVYAVLSSHLMYKDMRKQARLSTYLDGVWIDMFSQNPVSDDK